MKHSLIMENWRRYKKLEEGLFLLETKKITYESLLLKLENQEIAPLIYLESLDHYVTEQSKVYLTSINEGFLKDSVTSLFRKAINFTIDSMQKVTQILNKINFEVSMAGWKVIHSAMLILKKLVPVAKKVMKVMGPMVGCVIIIGLAMCSQSALAAGIDPETLKMAIPDEILKLASEIALDLRDGMEATEQITLQSQEIERVTKGGVDVVDNATELFVHLRDETASDKAGRVAELLQWLANKEGEMTIAEYQKIVNALDPEIADTLEECMKDARAMAKNDPEGTKKMANLEQFYSTWKGHLTSVVEQYDLSQTSGPEGDTQVGVSRSQSVSTGTKGFGRGGKQI